MSVTLSISDRPVIGLSDSELLGHLDDITAAERALAAARLATVAELGARGVPAARGYARPIAFLREHLKCHPGAAGQMHRLATFWRTRPEIADAISKALAKGAISEAQAAVITSSVEAITAEATTAEQTAAAALLLSQAAVLAPHELAICGNRILHHVAPHTAEQRDRARVQAAEDTAWKARALSIQPDGHGRYRLRGSTTAEGAAMLHAILDPLTHPRRRQPADTPDAASSTAHSPAHSPTDSPTADSPAAASPAGTAPAASPTADSPTADSPAGTASPADSPAGTGPAGSPAAHSTAAASPADTAAAGSPAAHSSADTDNTTSAGAADGGGAADSQAVPPAFRDPRSAAQRRHDALLEALRLLLATDSLPDSGGSKPQVAVTVRYDSVTRQLGQGLLDTGAALSAAEVRKFACEAGILPAILDSHGVPLDLGRERRLISGALRKALILRDRGCTWPGCDRPPRWCQAHHAEPWDAGGKTCLSNSLLACEFHHRLLHHDHGWTVHIGPDGHPWYTPPAHLDPQQTPRRNLYHHRD